MPRWQQHKIILPDGVSSHSAVFPTAGQHWAEYCAASITVSWRGENRGSSASGSLIDTRPSRAPSGQRQPILMVRKESDEMVGENPHASGSGQVRMHHQPEGLIRADLRLQALQAAGPRHKVRQDAQSEARGYCGNLGHERIGFDFTAGRAGCA